MKKVVMIPGPWHPVPPIKGAAVETWIYEVCKRLIKYQPYVISIGSEFLPEKEFKNGIFFYRIKFGKVYKRIFQKFLGWDIFSYNKRVFRIIKEINPNIVHIHNYAGAQELIENIRTFHKEIKIILHMHNIKSFEKQFPAPDLFLVCSKFLEKHYKKVFPHFSIKVLYNGVDVKKFLKGRQYGILLKNKLYPDKKIILFVGRVSPEKGVEKFVKLAELFKNEPDYQFICIGEISKKGERFEYYKKLQEFIYKKGIKNIEFWDYVPSSKVHYIYGIGDIAVISSQFEDPFPLVPLEIMASKVPIIAAAKGGMKEYMKDEENAIVIKEYENFEYIAKEKILELLSNPDKMRKIARNALETVRENFTWEKIASDLENIYDGLVKKTHK